MINKFEGVNRVCCICGFDFLDTSRFKPKQYCSSVCSNYSKYKNALEDSINQLSCTPEAKKIIRGDMFRFANILSKSTVTKVSL